MGTHVIRGRLITIEGGEGVGKTSLLQRLVASLTDEGREVVATREPGGTAIAEDIRRIFAHIPAGEELTKEAELFLISAARAQHVAQVIAPALERGAWVLCDRFADSTRVYQGRVGGLDSSVIETVIACSTFGIEPDLTFYLDCPVAIALQRLGQRHQQGDAAAGVGRYDNGSTALHHTLREGYRVLAKKFPQRIKQLDASQSQEAVAHHAIRLLKEL